MRELLFDAVENGASVGFLFDLDEAHASRYFDQVQAAMQEGEQQVWLALENGQVVGSVQLNLCRKPNGLNRAEVQKLLVHSKARRRGIARELMQCLELEAKELKRGLLYLDTEAGSEAESFYRTLGYTHAGNLPDYACSPDGTYRATAIYYKTLSKAQP
ncbi:acetyltransferase [Pseudomonas nitritireducens]|uniref:Acetyltransferase n=1 Tax=Pseudomonas nitroreducens TaxID=46680 RepID=A0A7W7KT09_PSENT|nr:acetyltransferase [Pseudomonas nitritireducens]